MLSYLRFIISCSFLVVFVCAYACPGERFSNIDSMYYWFSCQQLESGVVLAENKDNFTVEEEVLSALVFLSRGHIDRAERVLNYFYSLEKKASETGEFKGFFRYYQANGEPLSSEILSQTQLWLLVAVNEYSLKTGSNKFQPFAESLAKVVLDLEGPESGISAGTWGNTPLTYFNSFDNMLALSVFPKLWKWTEKSEYRFAAWRTIRFLSKFMWSDEKKAFRRKIFQGDFDLTDSLFACLVLGPTYDGWSGFPEPTDFYNRILLSFVYKMYDRQGQDKTILDDVAKNLIWSKKTMGSCGLPAVGGGPDIDIFTSALYLVAARGDNPFFVDPLFWKNKVLLPPAERQFHGDDFEDGRIKTLLAYPAELVQAKQCQLIVDWDSEDVKSGKGALKLYFNPFTQAKGPAGTVTRRFIDTQDFSTYSSMKVWIKVYTSVRTMERDLSVCIGLVDADDELWLSPELSLVGKQGFSNTIAFPSGWKRSPESKGNGVFNIERIKELKFVVSGKSDTPWQIFLDDLSFQ
jgi:hypothetical protein